MKTVFAIVLSAMIFSACQPKESKEEQVAQYDEETVETVEEKAVEVAPLGTVDPGLKPATVLTDTVGVYKLSDSEARAYVVEMNSILAGMETAIDENAPERFLKLMGQLRANQQGKQMQVQSKLSESDRTLFKTYMDKVADRLLALSDKLDKM
jgi:PBP1b-binding outer membrane lipoprotein LpoB